ncbi:MAG: hypothetical protein EOP60_11875 [Sphingomonadales bacterium]|nr:MAG: hypothetical protein EOP60_11875 [Sphingomonadales bacterium]
MIIRAISLSLFATCLLSPAIAQDASKPAPALVPGCPAGNVTPDHSGHNAPAAKPGGKVSVKDMTGPAAAKESSGMGTGKVSMQDMHRTAKPAGASTPAVQVPTVCPSPMP